MSTRETRISVNRITCEQAPLPAFLGACAAEGVDRVGLWRHHLDGDASAARSRCADAGVTVSSLCRAGFFTAGRSSDDDNKQAIAEAVDLGAGVLVVVPGPASDGDLPRALDQIRRGLAQLVPQAAANGVFLALEPFHPMFATSRSAVVTLEQANDLIEEVDDPHLGLALDSYHLWWDPRLSEQLARASGRVALVQLADWARDTTDLLRGRELPGDGVIDLEAFSRHVLAGGFDGTWEVEVLNEEVWARPVREVVRQATRQTEHLLTQARLSV